MTVPAPGVLALPPIADQIVIAGLDVAGAGPRALLALTPADASTTRTVHPLTLPADAVGGDDDAASAFPASETQGGADGVVINFHAGDASAPPILTLIAVTRPLDGPASALAAAHIAAALPAAARGAPPAVVAAAQRLPAAVAGDKGAVWGGDVPAGVTATWPPGAGVADAFAAAALHTLAAVGRRAALVTVAGHRPPAAGDDAEDDGLAAATLLGEAVAAAVARVTFSKERAARLAPARAVVRGAGAADELMYS